MNVQNPPKLQGKKFRKGCGKKLGKGFEVPVLDAMGSQSQSQLRACGNGTWEEERERQEEREEGHRVWRKRNTGRGKRDRGRRTQGMGRQTRGEGKKEMGREERTPSTLPEQQQQQEQCGMS